MVIWGSACFSNSSLQACGFSVYREGLKHIDGLPGSLEAFLVKFKRKQLSRESYISRNRVREAAAACASLNDTLTRGNVEVGSDECDVGHVENLRSVWQGQSPAASPQSRKSGAV